MNVPVVRTMLKTILKAFFKALYIFFDFSEHLVQFWMHVLGQKDLDRGSSESLNSGGVGT